jgi:uncharacterized protein YgiM (DUF1202 family)
MNKPFSGAMALLAAIITGNGALAGTLSIPRLPVEPTYRTVVDIQMKIWSNGSVNLREKPTTKSKVLTKLKPGTPITVMEKVEDGLWAHVKVNGMEGYIDSRLIETH